VKKIFFAPVLLAACAAPGIQPQMIPVPLVIAHRGLPGHLPEHTLEGYQKAIELGADFIETDLVSTKDGVLIARHEGEISGTTDAAEKFPKRKKKKIIDGASVEGWFSEDFTLAEIKTLRARERLPGRSQKYNGKFLVPTFGEVIALVKKNSSRKIGIYPEIKHPSYFRSLGLALEPKLVSALNKGGLNRRDAPVFVQSFEPASLRELKKELLVPLVQLLDAEDVRPYDFVLAGDPRTYGDLLKDAGLREVASYAAGIGPWKESIVSDRGKTDLVARAHARGLLVHPYTFRSDAGILPARYAGDPEKEYREFFALGADGVFSDFSDDALRARKAWLEDRRGGSGH
jgi:glycerophosphoryl diester phosphodiesterase